MKTYIKPSISIERIMVANTLLAGSGDFQASDVTLSSESVDNTNAYSRRHSLWDDDEE